MTRVYLIRANESFFFSSLTRKLFKGIESNEDKEELEEEEEVGYTNEHE